MMGQKRKSESGEGRADGRASGPTRRKCKTVDPRQGDNDAALDAASVTKCLPNSDIDIDEPQVEAIIKVDLEPKLSPNPLMGQSSVKNQEEFVGDFSNQVLDMGIDIGEVEVKLLRHSGAGRELILNSEDDGRPASSTASTAAEMISHLESAQERNEVGSSSKSSKGKLTAKACENFTAADGKNDEGEVNSEESSKFGYWKSRAKEVANQKLELEKKNWDLEADLAYWKGKAKELERNFLEKEPIELSNAHPQSDATNSLITGKQTQQVQLKQNASSGSSISTLPQQGEPDMTAAQDTNPQVGEATEDMRGFQRKINVLRCQLRGKQRNVKRLSQLNKQLLVENKRLTSFKATYRNANRDSTREPVPTGSPSNLDYSNDSFDDEDEDSSLTNESEMTSDEGEEHANDSTDVNKNPLLDEKIMDNVFQYIICQPIRKDVIKDIKNFRQVCKPWRNAATHLYRQTAPVLKFGKKYGDPLYLKGVCKMSFMFTFGVLRTFLEVMKDTEMIPFQSYEITGSVKTLEDQKMLEDFLRICGPDMVAVEFLLQGSGTFQQTFDLNGSPELDLSKMKTLVARICLTETRRDYDTSEAYAPVDFTRFLLNTSQTLREFKLEFYLGSEISLFDHTPLKKFEEIICRHIPESVKVLDLQMVLTDMTFTYLVEKGLSLKEFTFNPYYAVGGSETIQRFLTDQSPHLKVLRITSSIPWDNSNLDNSKENDLDSWLLDSALLNKLETLKLAQSDSDGIPSSFSEKFRKLNCLDVAQWKNHVKFVSFLESLKTTDPSPPNRFDMAPLVKEIVECFPNLRELRLEQGVGICSFAKFENVLEEVFKHFPSLEALHITILPDININLDSVLSGVSERDCTTLYDNRTYKHCTLGGLQRKASLFGITGLRKLVLKTNNPLDLDPVVLTDFSAHFVFMKLAELTELRVIGFCTKNKVRSTYRQQLKKKLRYFTWGAAI